MNRLYVDRVHADDHRRLGRPPAGRRGPRRRPRSPGPSPAASASASRRRRRTTCPDRLARHAGWIDAMARDLKARTQGAMPGHRRRGAAAGGPRAGAPDQPRAGQRRQDGRVPAPDRWRAGRPGRLAPRAGRRHRRRPGRHADHPGRQPGLRRPGRPGVRRAAARPARSGSRIHLGLYDDETAAALPLARPRGPRAGVVGRRPGLRRHGDDPAAADRAALRRQVGHRAAGASSWASPTARAWRSSATTGGARSLPGDFEAAWQQRPAQGRDRRHGPQGRRRSRPRSRTIPAPAAQATPGEGLELVFRPDPTIWDGRFANNGWLQELPKPMTRLTWDNAAFISPALADEAGDRRTSDVVELRYRRQVAGAAGLDPCRARPSDRSPSPWATAARRAGRVGNGVGVDVYPLRTADAPWFGSGLEVVKTGRRHRLAARRSTTSGWKAATLVRVADLETYRKKPDFAKVHEQDHGGRRGESLFDEPGAPGAPAGGRGQRLGHGDQPQYLHRLQRLRRRPARPRTTSRSSARSRSLARARCTGSASTATSRATTRTNPDDRLPAGALHALREGPVRGRLPGRRRRCTAPRGSTR